MQRIPKRTLIYDVSNILFRVAAVQKHKNPFAKDAKPEDLIGLCMHISLLSIYKWFSKYQPDFIVFAFEGDYGLGSSSTNWRKTFTAGARSRKAYKGNRIIDPAMSHYYELIDSFKSTMMSHTSICCLSIPTMEADDVIAGYCQLYSAQEHEIYIVSGDRDYIQLLKLPSVKLVSPDTGKLRNQPGDKDYEPDIDYWLFRKFVRGDMGDYVPSAYPRVKETRIKKAYQETYERLNLMNETWVDENKVTHKVGDLFNENIKLLSLYEQPTEQREILISGIKSQVNNVGKYSHFHFLKFLETYQLKAIRDNAMKFVDLFSNNQLFFKGLKTAKPLHVPKEKSQPQQVRLLEF